MSDVARDAPECTIHITVAGTAVKGSTQQGPGSVQLHDEQERSKFQQGTSNNDKFQQEPACVRRKHTFQTAGRCRKQAPGVSTRANKIPKANNRQ